MVFAHLKNKGVVAGVIRARIRGCLNVRLA
jgi:hypothetical protein